MGEGGRGGGVRIKNEKKNPKPWTVSSDGSKGGKVKIKICCLSSMPFHVPESDRL